MRRVSFLLGPLVVVLAACGGPIEGEPEVIAPPSTENTSETTTVAAAPPPVAEPSEVGACPYLDDAFVEETNGQRVAETKISVDETPACYFYRADGNVQLAVQVYNGGDPAVATAFVNQVAPVDTANPAELTGGWSGGAQPTDDGAVYAVAKEGAAVVVVTNQEQTLKAKLVAQETITALGL